MTENGNVTPSPTSEGEGEVDRDEDGEAVGEDGSEREDDGGRFDRIVDGLLELLSFF